jgi:putative protease
VITKRKIELLAPAKNTECAIQAIIHGADAVYIGAPKFGARSAAGNSLEDIKEVVDFAHQWNVKIYVTLNVILYDEELQEVEDLIWKLWDIGVDALIIQDMAITLLNIPPIELHASTQTDNRNLQKVKFLEETGFSQVVLARELSLEQIKEISSQTSVKLECFIHGALCVSYSGQCYLSQAMCGRSANRGECAQFCRLPYDLIDRDGNTLIRQKHLLSLKDLNRTLDLSALIDAGITSFKIEGRLKDVDYVKNITAWYRKEIDEIIAKRDDLVRSSIGETKLYFTPDPSKSFNRGFTDYFVNGRKKGMTNPDTPKSIGEKIGVVTKVLNDRLYVATNVRINNGDGFGFLMKGKTSFSHSNDETLRNKALRTDDVSPTFDNIRENIKFDGFRVNRAEGDVIFPSTMPDMTKGTVLYRNYDHEFNKTLERNSAIRFIPVKISIYEISFGFVAQMEDNYGNMAAVSYECEKVVAKRPQRQVIENEFSKLGNTNYDITEITVDFKNEWFLPVSVWSGIRKNLTDKMDSVLKINYRRSFINRPLSTINYPQSSLNYTGNVLNKLAEEFYIRHGVNVLEPAMESKTDKKSELSSPRVLMFNKYCLLHELGYCLKENKSEKLNLPLYLVNQGKRVRLDFDCKNCEMKLYEDTL